MVEKGEIGRHLLKPLSENYAMQDMQYAFKEFSKLGVRGCMNTLHKYTQLIREVPSVSTVTTTFTRTPRLSLMAMVGLPTLLELFCRAMFLFLSAA